jgi:hypothetical protein
MESQLSVFRMNWLSPVLACRLLPEEEAMKPLLFLYHPEDLYGADSVTGSYNG